MRVFSLKRKSIPKVAVLVMGLTAAVLVATINPPPAQAFPSKNANCANCHAVGGATTALPNTLTPAPGATYTVAITLAANPAGGISGYAIIPVTAGTGTINGGNTSAALTYSATMTAPAAAGTYVYNVYTNQGGTDPSGYASGTQYTITVAAAPVQVTTSTALAMSPTSVTAVAPAAKTLTATVTGAGAAGNVQFFNGTTSLGTSPVAAGTATLGLTNIAAGSYSYHAVFTPTSATAFTSSTSTNVAFTVTAAPVPAPTASFTASAISGIAPLAVTLADTSTGAPTSWLWTFGNGSTSNVQNPPVVTYTTAGIYTVELIVSNANGASAPVTKTITVTAAPVGVVPVSSFTSAVSATDPLTVTMTDTSSATPTSWAWNFGNGTTSTLQSPSVTYAAAGTYTVTLTATNADGAGNTATKDITVTAAPGTSTAHISRLSTDEGHVGSWVAITGTGFGPNAGTVKFGTVTATVMFWTDTTIGVKVPAGITDDEVDVTVIPVGGTASNGVEFKVEGDGEYYGDDYLHDGDHSDDSTRHYVRLGGYFD